MLILVIGVALWWAAHLFKRVAPEPRAALGDKGKGIVAVLLVLSVILMVVGYRMADGPFWWGPSPALKGINNLMMLAALWFFAADGMKSALVRRIRNPQLTGFSLWALAHLLVNGDLPSFVLFGGLLLWAVVEMVVLNRADPDWTRPSQPIVWRKEAMVLLAAFVTMVVVGLIHGWLGYNPFGG